MRRNINWILFRYSKQTNSKLSLFSFASCNQLHGSSYPYCSQSWFIGISGKVSPGCTCQNLWKWILKETRADLAPSPVCHFAQHQFVSSDFCIFQLGFLTIFVLYLPGTYQELLNAVSLLRALILNCICTEITLVLCELEGFNIFQDTARAIWTM